MLNLIAQETGNKGNIIYIGHSLGTALGLMYGAEFPDEAKSLVRLFILLSPSYKLGNMKSPYRHFRTMFPTVRVNKLLKAVIKWLSQFFLGNVEKIQRGTTGPAGWAFTENCKRDLFGIAGAHAALHSDHQHVLRQEHPNGTCMTKTTPIKKKKRLTQPLGF